MVRSEHTGKPHLKEKKLRSDSCVSKSFKSCEELWLTCMTAFGAPGELSEANHAELKLAASKIQPSTWHPHAMLPWPQIHHITQLSQCRQLLAFKSTAEWIAAVHMQPAPAWRQQAQLLDTGCFFFQYFLQCLFADCFPGSWNSRCEVTTACQWKDGKRPDIIGRDHRSRNTLEYHMAQNGHELCPEKSKEGFTMVHTLWASKTRVKVCF